jgi:nuclease S1
MKRFAAALGIVIACAGVRLGAWGPVGHEVIVRVALARTTPGAARLVRSLLGGEDPVDASLWADRVRGQRPETANWHFVNLPYGAATYVPSRDCRPRAGGDCLIAAINRQRAVLLDGSRPRAARAEALTFLLHLIGDLHQPLHVADAHDRGGNAVPVVVDGYTPPPDRAALNLHAAWDSVFIDMRGLNARRYADSLIARLESDRPREAGPVDIVGWALEAHALAERTAYAYPGFSPARPPAAPVRLDAAYRRAAQAAIDRQLTRAGVRLARVLNDAARHSAR